MHLGSTGILKIISSAGTKSMLCTGEFRGSVGSNCGMIIPGLSEPPVRRMRAIYSGNSEPP
ncbi:hypothetical protein, partial [Coprococcus comes]|uniref:hypothetical protein n=1 Tax=Coprococcus comes TaxID=410072 RepID=UPI001A9B723D